MTASRAIGHRVTDRRAALGWNQSELARRAGIGISYVNRLEAGFYKRPSVDMLAKVAAALGCRVADLTEPPLDTEASRVRDLLIDAGYDSNGADVLDALARELLTLTQSERDAILPSMLAQIRAIRAVARR